MIDPICGYDDTPVCGCKPCPRCDGEGQKPLRVSEGSDGRGPDCPVVLEYQDCPMCKGSGKDSSDCEIPSHWPDEVLAAIADGLSQLDVIELDGGR